MSKRRRWVPSLRTLLIAVALGSIPSIYLGALVTDAVRERRSESIDRPDVLLTRDEVGSLSFADPLHLPLPDGRTFRLAHLIAPAVGTAEYTAAAGYVWQPLAWGGNRQRG